MQTVLIITVLTLIGALVLLAAAVGGLVVLFAGGGSLDLGQIADLIRAWKA